MGPYWSDSLVPKRLDVCLDGTSVSAARLEQTISQGITSGAVSVNTDIGIDKTLIALSDINSSPSGK